MEQKDRYGRCPKCGAAWENRMGLGAMPFCDCIGDALAQGSRCYEEMDWLWTPVFDTEDILKETTGMKTFPDRVAEELERARSHFPPMNSAHEGFAVLLEEVGEFWFECTMQPQHRDARRMMEELVQIAAMAQRTAEDICMSALLEEDA